ncbi:hypothetical protein SDC9_191452 [bioreactor metagenome]|uniref:Uncharacterized protein n=1 Tax=bioreactor metagenome TaxID=1076179 RepID=A0A645HXX7_9ZZZZ
MVFPLKIGAPPIIILVGSPQVWESTAATILEIFILTSTLLYKIKFGSDANTINYSLQSLVRNLIFLIDKSELPT